MPGPRRASIGDTYTRDDKFWFGGWGHVSRKPQTAPQRLPVRASLPNLNASAGATTTGLRPMADAPLANYPIRIFRRAVSRRRMP